MAGPSIGGSRWSIAVSLIVAAAMATIALITVQRAGCDDPGHYVLRGSGYELVGGCVEPGDLPVASAPAPSQANSDRGTPVRP
jgi:hypothetical protein